MIWFRRIIALPLALIFIVLSIPILLFFRVNGTLGNPDFYNEQLRRADIYNFIYDDLLPAALAEANFAGDISQAGIDISQLKPYVIDMAEQTVAPEWLETQVEQAVNGVVPYVWGDTESFNIRITLKDRVVAAGGAIKNTLHKEEVSSALYDQLIVLVLDKLPSDGESPLPLALTRDEMELILRRVLPEEWVLMQVGRAIDEVVPYLTGDKAEFIIKVDISERLDAFQVVVVDILKRPETYGYLFEDLLTSAVEQNIQGMGPLPFGVELTGDEIISAMRQAFPLEWYQAQVTEMVAQIFAYLRGTAENLDIVLPLADRKPAIAGALGELADQKLESLIDSLPVCTTGQLLDLMLNPPLDRLPECRPPGVSYQQLKELLGVDISLLIAPFIDDLIPDQFVLSETELRQMFGGGGEEDFLSQARELVQSGLIYTDEDLRNDLGADYETVENIRQRIASGFVFTEKELQDWLSGGGVGQAQTLASLRSGIGTAHQWLRVVWVIPVLLLAAVGALGGRGWRSKLIWAASVLAVAALIAYIVFGPLFSAVVQPQLDAALLPMGGQAEGLGAMVAAKGIVIAQNAVASFIGGIKSQALGILAVSILLIGLMAAWPALSRIRRG
jgi:hypothetical protein